MGWMRILNSDDVEAVLAILPFQDANAPAGQVAQMGWQLCSLFYF